MEPVQSDQVAPISPAKAKMRQSLWSVMRILKRFDIPMLMLSTGAARDEAQELADALCGAGYLAEDDGEGKLTGNWAVWRVERDAGAQVPGLDMKPVDHAPAWRRFEEAGADAQDRARQRLRAVEKCDTFWVAGRTRTEAIEGAAQVLGIGNSTLWRWMTLVANIPSADRLPYLLDSSGGGRPRTAIDAGAWEAIKADFGRPEKPSLISCYQRLKEGYAKPRGIALPSQGVFRLRLMEAFPERFEGQHGPRAYKATK